MSVRQCHFGQVFVAFVHVAIAVGFGRRFARRRGGCRRRSCGCHCHDDVAVGADVGADVRAFRSTSMSSWPIRCSLAKTFSPSYEINPTSTRRTRPSRTSDRDDAQFAVRVEGADLVGEGRVPPTVSGGGGRTPARRSGVCDSPAGPTHGFASVRLLWNRLSRSSATLAPASAAAIAFLESRSRPVPCWASIEERIAALARPKLAIIAKRAVGSAIPRSLRSKPGGSGAEVDRMTSIARLIDLRTGLLE